MQLPQTNSFFTLNQPPPTNSTSHQVYFLARDTPRCASLPASVPFANFRCFIADILRIEKQFTQTNPNASKNRPFLFKRILFQYKVAECSTVFSLTNWGIVQFVTSVIYEKTKYPTPAQGGGGVSTTIRLSTNTVLPFRNNAYPRLQAVYQSKTDPKNKSVYIHSNHFSLKFKAEDPNRQALRGFLSQPQPFLPCALITSSQNPTETEPRY